MNDQYIYIPTPVSELPEKDGFYEVLNTIYKFKYTIDKGWPYNIPSNSFYLKPILKTEYDRAIIHEAMKPFNPWKEDEKPS